MIVELRHGHKLIIDCDEYNKFKQYNLLTQSGRNTNYVRLSKNGKTYMLHRLIINAKKGQVVDHINGNGLDNRKENLRIVSNAENIRNTKISRGFSKYRGVSFRKDRDMWAAELMFNFKRHRKSGFKTELEAYKYRLELEKKYNY